MPSWALVFETVDWRFSLLVPIDGRLAGVYWATMLHDHGVGWWIPVDWFG
jgi:hypothetical protein